MRKDSNASQITIRSALARVRHRNCSNFKFVAERCEYQWSKMIC
jgi:hypothetical protein